MASDEQFSLCWNNFHANMSAGFHGLLSRGDLVDVTLAAEGRLLQAHKLVLSVCSPYFQEMFKMNPTQHPIVFLKDVSHSALRDLLQFMYQGEVNVKQEELATFISTAEQLQVKGLTGNQNEESSTPSKPKPTSRPGPRSSHQRQSVKLETELESKPSTPVAIKRTNRPSIASNNSSSSQSGPAKRKCIDPLEAGPSGSAKEDFVTIPDEDENNAVAPKMEPEFVNESMWDEDDDGANNDETNFGEDDSNMDMSGFDGSTTGDGTISAGGEGGAVGDAQDCNSPLPLGARHIIEKKKHINENVSANDSHGISENITAENINPNKPFSTCFIREDHLMVGCQNVASPDLPSKNLHAVSLNISSAASINTVVSSCQSSPGPLTRCRRKKRVQNYDDWKDVTRKRLRNGGKEYSSKKGLLVPAKSMGKPCACKNKCFTKLTLEERQDAFDKFWKLGIREKQWLHVANYSSKQHKKRGLQRVLKNNRQFTYKYFLPKGSSKIEVCRVMFLSTYSITERLVRTAWDKYDGSTLIQKDMRGKHKNHNRIVDEDMVTSVCAHVKSFVPVESHYNRAASKSLHLDGDLSVARMFSLYKEWPELNSYSNTASSLRQYRDIVNTNFNLSFHK
ncbi:protein tramtrack, alpha isoform isoform X2 [Pieris rapae]|uniref:protein tramtrack, alpha isoform isoform X2 n=1 Tax=Pieris rapae TaxID=64459 RepID=UPI001E27C4CD|nr:protein tramtrack, alpha isoform isoform X2 [Pieris rapae]